MCVDMGPMIADLVVLLQKNRQACFGKDVYREPREVEMLAWERVLLQQSQSTEEEDNSNSNNSNSDNKTKKQHAERWSSPSSMTISQTP
jgi:hypothetical protein